MCQTQGDCNTLSECTCANITFMEKNEITI